MATYPEATFKANALSEPISQLGTKIDKLADSISAQTQNIGRLERAVTDLLTGINAQREMTAGRAS
jgi:ABC-type transporter Mla subunit MlaD